MSRADREWSEAVAAWEVALALYKMRLAYGRIDQDYRKAGRQARKALRRCFALAHCGDASIWRTNSGESGRRANAELFIEETA